MEETRKEKAVRLFQEGYNCSQSVFLAYSDLFDLDRETACRISASFGAGMGRMREVCGTVSGMSLVAGLINGAVEGPDTQGKKHNYETVQKMAAEFKKRSGGSIICRELLGLSGDAPIQAAPEERTEGYYKKRPCIRLIQDAVEIIEEVLADEALARGIQLKQERKET